MTINVKFLSEQQIESDTQDVLEAYFHELGQSIQVPVPADEILETHLGLSLDFDDLGSRLGIPGADVLGALCLLRSMFSVKATPDKPIDGKFRAGSGKRLRDDGLLPRLLLAL